MKILIIINIILNIIFLLIKHPISIGTIIIIQTVIISIITGIIYKSFWFAYILFLIYIGGIIVLFIYITRLIPNIIFSIPIKRILTITLTLILITIFISNKINIFNNDIIIITTNKLILIKMYTYPINITIILLVIYLLYTIITVFNITDSNKRPLRITYN